MRKSKNASTRYTIFYTVESGKFTLESITHNIILDWAKMTKNKYQIFSGPPVDVNVKYIRRCRQTRDNKFFIECVPYCVIRARTVKRSTNKWKKKHNMCSTIYILHYCNSSWNLIGSASSPGLTQCVYIIFTIIIIIIKHLFFFHSYFNLSLRR